ISEGGVVCGFVRPVQRRDAAGCYRFFIDMGLGRASWEWESAYEMAPGRPHIVCRRPPLQPLTFHPHHDAPPNRCRLIGQGAMREKPIQKEHIACGAGERERWCAWDYLRRYIKLPISGLLVWVRLLVHAWQHFQCPIG